MSKQFAIVRNGLLAAVLGVACVLPVAAQTPGTSGTTGTTDTATTQRAGDDRDWGWLGLLGLIGLFGLRRNHHVDTTDRTRTASAR